MSSPTYRLETLGTVALKGSGLAIRAADQRHQRRRLALLSALASTGDRGMSRDQLLLLFWPDSTQKKARHSLDQLLYALRTSLGESIFLGTNPIRLNADFISSDVSEFNKHVADGHLEEAVSVYAGPFLDGFYLSETREFEEWVESERRRLSLSYETALDQLAQTAERNGDHSQAIHWRRKLVEADALSTRYAVALMTALANAGDVSAAIAHGERYERDAAESIGETASSSVRQLVAQLRELPPAPIVAQIQPPAANDNLHDAPLRQSRVPVLLALSVVAVVAIVGTSLLGRQSGATESTAAARGTTNIAAWDLYVRGRDPVMLRNDSTATVALNYFNQAIALDSGFAAAHAGAATMYTRLAMSDAPRMPRTELRRRAFVDARRAISINDSLPDAHRTLGLLNSYWLIDLKAAQNHLERATALDPRDYQAREYLALVYTYLGRRTDALRQLHEATSRNPLAPSPRVMRAAIHYTGGRCDLAVSAVDSLKAMNPPLLRARVIRGLCLASEAKWTQLEESVREGANSGGIRMMGLYGLALAHLGKRPEALAWRTKLRGIAQSNPAAWFDASVVSFGLGETDTAFTELGRAVDAGVLPWEIFGPPFAELRRDPRFARFTAAKGIRL